MAEENENAEQQPAKKSSKMKFILIGLIILILLIVIFVVVYLLVLSPKDDKEAEAAQTAVPQATQPAAVPQAPAVQAPAATVPNVGMDLAANSTEMGQIYPLPTMNVNLADPTGVTYLSITLELEFDPKNSALLTEIETKTPRILDMIITVLSSKAYEEISTGQGKLNLKNEFLRRINAMLAKGKLYNVYLTSFVVQRQ